jgi:hypothetical protein
MVIIFDIIRGVNIAPNAAHQGGEARGELWLYRTVVRPNATKSPTNNECPSSVVCRMDLPFSMVGFLPLYITQSS